MPFFLPSLVNTKTKLHWSLFALILLATLVNLVAQDQETGIDRFRVDVNLVTLRFTVKNSSDQLVNRLSKDVFTVFENGREMPVRFFEQPRQESPTGRPLWLAFMIDVSGSTFATRAEEILAAQSFFDNVHSFTRVGIFGFTDKLITFQDFTSDRNLVLGAFSSARKHLGRTAIYDSLGEVSSLLNQKAGPADRKVVIVISDGMDDNYSKVRAAVERARRQNITVYSVWVPSAAQLYIGPARGAAEPEVSSEKAAERQAKRDAFAQLAVESGGRHFGGFETILDFDDVLAEINDELFGNLYSIGYITEDPYLTRIERNIEVKVSHSGAFVHGLFKNVPDQVATKKRYIEALFDNSVIADLPVRNGSFHDIGTQLDILRQREDRGQSSLPFRLKISPYSLNGIRDGEIRTQLGIIGLVLDSDGKEVGRMREIFRASLDRKDLKEGRGITYTNRILAEPGKYVFRLAVIEIPSWRMSVMDRPIRID